MGRAVKILDPDTGSPCPWEAFKNFTWHRSEPNRTGQDKIFYAIAYQLTAA